LAIADPQSFEILVNILAYYKAFQIYVPEKGKGEKLLMDSNKQENKTFLESGKKEQKQQQKN
jgi:hypothetical protein